jgi:GH15 family glucan-1,4-alpha-glucosidase
MAKYVDGATKLPHASYDLWEEKFLTTTYTTATVYAALKSAVAMAEKMGRQQDAVHWQTVADEMYDAAHSLLFNKERGYFYKGFTNEGEKGLQYDGTIDASSFYGAMTYGLFALDSEEMKTSMQTLDAVFGFKPDEPTPLQRYEYDQYYTTNPAGFGNPWFVTTLWLAEYDMRTGNMARAMATISWVKDRMLRTGVLPEQINMQNLTFASVAPLAWSQAEFLSCLLDLASQEAEHGS